MSNWLRSKAIGYFDGQGAHAIICSTIEGHLKGRNAFAIDLEQIMKQGMGKILKQSGLQS